MVLKGHACKELCRDDAPATAGGGELVGSVSSPPLAQCVQRLVGTVMQCVGASALAPNGNKHGAISTFIHCWLKCTKAIIITLTKGFGVLI